MENSYDDFKSILSSLRAQAGSSTTLPQVRIGKGQTNGAGN